MTLRFSATIRLMVGVYAVAFAMPATAQTLPAPDSYAPEPAHLAYLDGAATIDHDGRAEPATANLPIVAGDRLRTGEGRAEVIFGDGSVLDLDHFTSVDFQSDQLLRLMDGRLRLSIGGRDRVSFRIDTPSSSVRIDVPGEYRVSLLGDGHKVDVELVTYRGYAALVNEHGETTVSAGERAYATASLAPSYAQAYNSAVTDAFDQWAADRYDERTGTTSARYLPDDVRGYSGVLDRNGDWQYDASYGYVWYPRVVVGWRPYYHGRWDYYGPWGWTWVAYDPWGWPTHHYGRWGYNAGLWFWIPGRHWGAAWVYWGSGPNYVGWCPLGWGGGPVINVNVYSGNHGWYSAWTMMPRHAFGHHADVGRWAVRTGGDHAVPRGFIANGSMPVTPTGNFVRARAPIYSAGRADYAVRRGGMTAPSNSAPANSFTRPAMSDQAPRQYRRGPDGREMPRSALPPSPGALGQARPRNADVGTGGAEGDTPRTATLPSATGGYQPRTGGYQPRTGGYQPSTGGYEPRTGGYEPRTAPMPPMTTADPRMPATRRDSGDLGPGGATPVYTPPQRDRAPRYSPPYGAPANTTPSGGYERPIPREATPRYAPPENRAPEAAAPGGAYERRAPSSPAPGYERAAPRGGDAPHYAPPSGAPRAPQGAPAGGYERRAPERQAPPSTGGGAPSRGGGERAAPRGGGGGNNSGGGGGHQRRPG